MTKTSHLKINKLTNQAGTSIIFWIVKTAIQVSYPILHTTVTNHYEIASMMLKMDIIILN